MPIYMKTDLQRIKSATLNPSGVRIIVRKYLVSLLFNYFRTSTPQGN